MFLNQNTFVIYITYVLCIFNYIEYLYDKMAVTHFESPRRTLSILFLFRFDNFVQVIKQKCNK